MARHRSSSPTSKPRLLLTPETAVPGFMGLALSIAIAVLSLALYWNLGSPVAATLLLALGIASTALAVVSIIIAVNVIRFGYTRSQFRTELQSSEAALRRQNEYLTALHETALALINRLELDPLLESILARAAAFVGTPHGYIDLLLPDSSGFEQKTGYGIFADTVGTHLAINHGVGGKVWRTGERVIVDDYATWPERAPEFADASFHATVGVPLKSGGKVVGVIGLAYAETDRKFGAEQVEQLSRFAEMASLALDNARLYAATQTELAERKRSAGMRTAMYRIAQAANDASTLDELFRAVHENIRAIMPADNFYISLYDEKENLISFPYFVDEVDEPAGPKKPGRGLTEYVLRTGKPLFCTADVHEKLEQMGEAILIGAPSPIWLGVPLIVGKRPIGVMAVQHYSDPNAYGEADLGVLEFVSSEVARAIDLKRARDALQQERDFALQVMSSLGQGLAVTDLKQFEFVNQAYARLLGYTPEELMKIAPENLAMPDDLPIVEEHRQQRQAGETTSYEARLKHADGHPVPVLVTGTPRWKDGQVTGSITIVTDLTERKRAEEAVRKSEEIFRALAENVPGVVFQCPSNEHYNFTYLNDAIEDLTGYPKQAFLQGQLKFLGLLHPSDAAWMQMPSTKESAADSNPQHITYRIQHKSGEWRWVEEWGTAIAAGRGVHEFFEGIMIDITERKRTEEALSRNALELAALSHMGQVVAATLDLSVVLTKVIDEVSPLLQAEGISVLLPEGDTRLVFAATSGPASAGLLGLRIPMMAGAAGGVMHTGQTVYLSNGASDSQLYREIEDTGQRRAQSLLAVPLSLGGEIIGVMEAVHTQPNAFSSNDQRLLEAAANWAAIGIGNARQHEQTQRRLRESETMAAISRALNETLDVEVILQFIVDSAMQVIPRASRAIFHLFDETQELLVPVAASGARQLGDHEVTMRPGEGIAGQVFAASKLINIGNTASAPGYIPTEAPEPLISLLAAPVESRARKLGTLTVDSRQHNAFTADDERLLTNLGVQAAIAIEKARIFESARRRADELNAASEILRALNAAPSLPYVFPIISTGLRAITRCEHIGLGLFDDKMEWLTISAIDSPRDGFRQGTRLRIHKDSAAAKDYLDGRPHLTPNLADELETETDRKMYEGGVRSRISFPLRAGSRVIGTLNIAWRTPRGYSAAQLPMLEQIADAIALAVEKNRLFAETAEILAREQRLNEMTRAISGALDSHDLLDRIARLAAELVNADAASLALTDNEKQNVTSIHLFNFPQLYASSPLPRGQGVVWSILESGESMLLTDYKLHPKALPEWIEAGVCAFIGVPIAVGQNRFGVLGLFGLTPEKTFTTRDVSLAESVGLQAGIAIQNSKLFEALAHEKRRIELLYSLSQNLTTTLDPSEVASRAIELTSDAVGADVGHITVHQPDSNRLRLLAVSGRTAEFVQQLNRQFELTTENSFSGQAAITKKAMIISDASAAPRWYHLPDINDGIESGASIPLLAGDTLVGVLTLLSREKNFFRTEQLPMLAAVAAPVALALQNAHLFEAERQRVEALTALHQTSLQLNAETDLATVLNSIIERAARLLDAPLGSLRLLTPDHQWLDSVATFNFSPPAATQRIKMGEGAAGRAAQTGEAIIINDYAVWESRLPSLEEPPFKSVITVPIKWRGLAMGVISIGDNRPARFTRRDVELVSLFADQAATAIANTHQHQILQRRLQESDALASISRGLIETLDTQRTLSLIVESARRIIPHVDRAVIHLLDPDGHTLQPASVAGPGDAPQTQMIMRPGEGIAGQVIAQGIVINVADTHTDPRYLTTSEQTSRTRSLLVAPVQSGTHRIGTLSVNSSKPNAFSADDERLLGTLGIQAALAIYNAQLYEDTRRQLDELLLLHTIAIAGAEATSEDELIARATRLMGETLDSANFGVMLLDESGKYLRPHRSYNSDAGDAIPLGHGITGRVAATGQAMLVPDVAKEAAYIAMAPNIRSEVCVPLKAGAQILGVVNAESERANTFTQTDLRLLSTLAGQLATAILKLRLYHDLEQALRQEKAARAQLVQAEKLAAMGRLVASVAHELNNPLQAIQNALYLVKQEPRLSAQSIEDLQVATTEADRMAELIGRLRDTYRPASGEEFRPESLNAIILDIQRLITTHLRHNNIEFQFDPDPDLPAVYSIRDQLKQVILNLCLNAVEAMPPNGRLTIRTRYEPKEGGAVVTVHDTGVGIPTEALNNIFDPFFTTKDSGTGLGLTITYDIIQRHRGRIEVQSESGKGTTFTICLPTEIESEAQ